MDVWRMIVSTRAPQEWSGIDEHLAADLCITTIALRDMRERLAGEDPVIIGARGTPIINPLMPIVSSLLNQTLRLSHRLRLSVQDANEETNTTTAAARQRKREAEHRDELIDDDADLIARPTPRVVAISPISISPLTQ